MDPFAVGVILETLPELILPSIFEFIPREDLMNWRIVSSRYYGNCTVGQFMKKEKFVFHYALCGKDDAFCLGEDIKRCNRIRPTIEFHGFSLRRLPLSIWGHIGESLTSLLIQDCFVNDEIITEIILHCRNLVSLHLQAHSSYADRVPSTRCLDRLIERGEKRPRLRSLKIFSRLFPIPDEPFLRLFQIFPNIEIFGRDFLFLNHDMQADDMIQFFSHPTRIVKIELRILLIVKRETRESLMALLKTNIVEILKRVPKIRALEVDCNCIVSYSEKELGEFLGAIKNLESLRLKFHNFNFVNFSNPTNLLPKIEYNHLTDLQLTCPTNHSRLYDANIMSREILKRCSSSLKYLHISGELIHDDVKECIMRDHTELKKLMVTGIACHEDCETKLHRAPIDRLQNLEFLDFNFREKFCPEIVPLLNTSRLKAFQTKCENSETLVRLLEVLAMKAPHLEILSITAVFCTFVDDFLQYFEKFQKLRYLVLNERWEVIKGDSSQPSVKGGAIESLFRKCPSLVYVLYPSCRMVSYRSRGSVLHTDHWYSDNICDNLAIFRSVDYSGL